MINIWLVKFSQGPFMDDKSAILDVLDRILSSERFVRSERSRTMLSYIVEETLAGRGKRLKAYTIAIDVFGRDENFDPDVDTLVRVQATRLRELLEAYYKDDTSEGIVEIRIPKGGYVATFPPPNSYGSAVLPHAPALRGASILSRFAVPIGAVLIAFFAVGYYVWGHWEAPSVGPSSNDIMPQVAVKVTSTNADGDNYSEFIKLRADAAISRFGQVYVSRSRPGSLVVTGVQPAFLIRIITSTTSAKLKAHMQIVEQSSETVVSSSEISLPLHEGELEFSAFDAEITHMFSGTGPVFQFLLDRTDLHPDLNCILETLNVRFTNKQGQRLDLMECLESAIARHPSLGMAGAQLASFLITEGKFNRTYKGRDAFAMAKEVLNTTLKNSPDLSDALIAMAALTFAEGDIETAFAFDRRAIANRPNASILRGRYAKRLIFAGRFGEGETEMQKSIAQSKHPRIWQRTYLYLAQLEIGVKKKELEHLALIAMQTEGINGVASFFANIELGNKSRALDIINNLENGTRPSSEFLRNIFLKQGFRPQAAEKMVVRAMKSLKGLS